MTNLTRFEQDGIEIHIDNTTGESFVTQMGYVRLSGKPKQTISDRIKGVRLEDLKMGDLLTPGGLQGVRLISEELVCKWIIKDNPEVAEKFLRLGVRKFLHTLAGYQVEETPKKPPLPESMTPEMVEAIRHYEYWQEVGNQPMILKYETLLGHIMEQTFLGLPARSLPRPTKLAPERMAERTGEVLRACDIPEGSVTVGQFCAQHRVKNARKWAKPVKDAYVEMYGTTPPKDHSHQYIYFPDDHPLLRKVIFN